MSRPDFGKMSAVEALDHPLLPEANAIADRFREMAVGLKWIGAQAYSLAYSFYAGKGWENMTDRERKAYLLWVEAQSELARP